MNRMKVPVSQIQPKPQTLVEVQPPNAKLPAPIDQFVRMALVADQGVPLRKM